MLNIINKIDCTTLKMLNLIGQPDAVGSPMNVMKFSVIDKMRFIFLSQNDGIGFFNGQKVVKLSEE